jgi:hypothetical protein
MALFNFHVRVRINDFSHQENSELPAGELTSVEVQKKLAAHIRDAVKSWGGQLYPYDVLFSANIKQVTARPEDIELSKAEQKHEAVVIEDRRKRGFPTRKVGKKNVSNQKLRKGGIHL